MMLTLFMLYANARTPRVVSLMTRGVTAGAWGVRFRRVVLTASAIALLCNSDAGALHASPFSSALTIDPLRSNITITAKALGLTTSPTSQNIQALSGFIDANFSFEQGGGFSPGGLLGIVDAEVLPAGPFSIVLGQQSGELATVELAELLTGLEKLGAAAEMALASETEADYSIDASQFALVLRKGTVRLVLGGSLDQTIDLAAFDPLASASAPAGTLGSIAFREHGASGLYQLIDVQLSLPLDFKTRVVFAGSVNVDIELNGAIHAASTVYASLAGIPGDFDEDLQVTGPDLHVWEGGFGHAVGGADLLEWQRHFGMAPPSVVATSATPEPGSGRLVAVLALAALTVRRVSGRFDPPAS